MKGICNQCTYQLSLSQVPLPPEVFLHGGYCGQTIVGVHTHMDETVKSRPKETLKKRFWKNVLLIDILDKPFTLNSAVWSVTKATQLQ